MNGGDGDALERLRKPGSNPVLLPPMRQMWVRMAMPTKESEYSAGMYQRVCPRCLNRYCCPASAKRRAGIASVFRPKIFRSGFCNSFDRDDSRRRRNVSV